MNSASSPEEGPADVTIGAGQMSNSRRRLLRGGVGVAPVLLTMISRPVLATTCKSASATTSANASRPSVTPCIGVGPLTWKGWPASSWPSDAQPTAKWSAFFPTTAVITVNKTLLWVLQTTGTGENEALARNMVAALLNLKGKKTSVAVADEGQLRTIYTQALAGGYSPAAGVTWSAADVNVWLKGTFGTQ